MTRVSAQEAWKKISDASSVIVAVVDNGIYYDHPNLKGNIWQNKKEIGGAPGKDDDGNGMADDFHGARFIESTPSGNPIETTTSHGTRIAGIIGGTGKDNPQMKGIAPRVQMLSAKFMENNHGDPANGIKAISYAIRSGAEIINLSWGLEEEYPPLKDCIEQVSENEKTRKVLFVVAAGNRGKNIRTQLPHYPASYAIPNMIVVTSTIRRVDPELGDMLGSGSSFDSERVHIAAPGYEIFSTTSAPGYSEDAGTTYAAAHVSGAAALLKAMHPDWTAMELKAHLMASVDKMELLKDKVASGGRLNVRRAVYGPLTQVSSDGGTAWTIGGSRVIRWQNQYDSPVCRSVDLLWSADGGRTFPIVLAKAVGNGVGHALQRAVTVPQVATTQGVVRVQCSGTKFNADLAGLTTTD